MRKRHGAQGRRAIAERCSLCHSSLADHRKFPTCIFSSVVQHKAHHTELHAALLRLNCRAERQSLERLPPPWCKERERRLPPSLPGRCQVTAGLTFRTGDVVRTRTARVHA
jgi:hypothetical protein